MGRTPTLALLALAALAAVLPAAARPVREVDAMEALPERPAAELGFELTFAGAAFVQRSNVTEFRYSVRMTGGEDLSYLRVGVSCDVELELLDHRRHWRVGVDRFSGARGYRRFGAPVEAGSADFVLAVRGAVGTGAENTHTVAGPAGWATVVLPGPDCAASRAYERAAELPAAEVYECDDPAAKAALETPDGATDRDTDGARCPQEREVARTQRLVSAAGLVTEVTFTVSARDNTAPVFEGIEKHVVLECGVDPEPAEPVARDYVSDNCEDAAALEVSDACETERNSTCEANSITTRTWTAADACGNAVCFTQSVVRVDSLPPEIEAPADATVECDGTGREVANGSLADATITDACGDCYLDRRYEELLVTGGCGLERQHQRFWRAVDCCGNEASERQLVRVVDTTAPTLELAAYEAEQECGAGAPAPPAVAASEDKCSASAPEVSGPELLAEDASDRCARRYTFGYTACDECNNVAAVNATVTVVDTTAPVLSGVPADVTVECGAELPPAAEASCSDECQGGGLATAVASSTSSEPGACAGTRTVTRTYACDDGCGNQAAPASQTVTVVDTTAPEWAAEPPADLTVECDEEAPAPPTLEAVDSCDPDVAPATAVVTEEARTCRFNYTEVRRWETSDCSGNKVTHEQRVVHRDSTPPTIKVGDLPAGAVQCMADVRAMRPHRGCGSDNCGNVTIGLCQETEREDGACRDRATVRRTYTVTDECGLTAEHVQTIDVFDSTAPEFAESRADRAEAARPDPSAEPAPAAADNCGGVAQVTAHHSEEPGLVRFAFAAADACGNVAWLNYTASY